MTLPYTTKITYANRETKPVYVHDKYRSLLQGTVLDVGADRQYLKPYVERDGGKYTGVGWGNNVDYHLNLDADPLPFADHSYDTVLCLDVLEHLENIHFMFSELCRVASKHVIISLPNPYNVLISRLIRGDYSPTTHMKFYGLPPEPPQDRHRWFFSNKEAKAFLRYNASKVGWSIIQMDGEGEANSSLSNRIRRRFYSVVLNKLFHSDIDSLELFHGTLWCVLEKKRANRVIMRHGMIR